MCSSEESPGLINFDDAVGHASLHSPRGKRATTGDGRHTDANHGLAGTRPFFQILPPLPPALVPAVSLLAAGGCPGADELFAPSRCPAREPSSSQVRPDDSRLSPDRLASSQVGDSVREAATAHRAARRDHHQPAGTQRARRISSERPSRSLEVPLPATVPVTEGRPDSNWDRGQREPTG